jgi:hypothetical protein
MADHFKPTVGARITKAEALKWIDKFEKERKKDTKAVFYGRDTLLKMLKNTRISGISFFFCRKTDKNGKEYDDLVLVPTLEDGTLVWGKDPSPEKKLSDPASLTVEDDEDEGAYENGTGCPPYCTPN